MDRLADYIAVVELKDTLSRHNSGSGVIKQKVPENDWPDAPFAQSLPMFCMPQGWTLRAEQPDPTYYVATLTDLMGAHQYACCLQFYEHCSKEDVYSVDEESVATAAVFKPKVLVILTRYTFFDFFRVFLLRLRTSLMDDGDSAEKVMSSILSIRSQSQAQFTLFLGKERFTLRVPQQKSVPMTDTVVNGLVRNLGSLHNLLVLFRSVLSDQKIILHSVSMKRLSSASYAIKAMIFPLEYTYTFVTVLPEQLLEYLESPTPYIMGVFTDAVDKLPPVDAVIVDLDLGEVRVPSNVDIPELPSPFKERLVTRLHSVLSPELRSADLAQSHPLPPSDPFVLDKKVRCCFLLFMAELLYGYRSCLQLVRLSDNPLIVFHKAAFMGLRRMNANLVHHMLEGQMFQVFVVTRGVPYRQCDVFDEIVCRNPNLVDPVDHTKETETFQRLCDFLADNERQEPLPVITINGFVSHTTKIRNLDSAAISFNGHVDNDTTLNDAPNTSKIVPFSPVDKPESLLNSRRIQVLTSCLVAIFEGRLWEARKMMSAVELALRLVETRVYLCRQLSILAIPVTKATLNPQQFELVVRLLNCALEQESEDDEHGVAYACLHLCNLYCRRLTQGVHQFAYTCVQDHPVWSNHKFWESAFFHDVHELMRRNYGHVTVADSPLSGESVHDMWNIDENPTGMDIAAENMQSNARGTDQTSLKEQVVPEESIIYGQAKHYINLMVFLRVPLDPSRLRRVDKNDLEKRGNAVGRRDMPQTTDVDSDCESGFTDGGNDGDVGASVVNWISKLIDRLCCAARLDSQLVERLISDIPGFVAVHVDNLEQAYAESRKLAPPPKSKLVTPVLVTPCEKVLLGGLRCVMLADSASDNSDNSELCTSFLPAEGAVYLTNYRVVFKGRPVNPFLNEKIVVRCVPIMSVIKEKSINEAQMLSRGFMQGISTKVASGLHDAIQIRSSCFMLIRLAFDEDVSPDQAEEFSKMLTSLRWPSSVPQTLFAFSPVSYLLSNTLSPGHKKSTMRDFKKTIIKGLPLKGSLSKKTDRAFEEYRQSMLPSALNNTLHNESDYLEIDSDGTSSASGTIAGETSAHYTADFTRLRFKGDNSPFRWSHANRYYDISKSYPTVLVVPCSTSDGTFAKVAKGFKNGRLPTITWISENGALLIRGAGFVSGNVLDKIKKKQATLLHSTDSGSNLGSQITIDSKESDTAIYGSHTSTELQEAYMCRLALASPSSSPAGLADYKSESNASLISLESLFTVDGSSVCTGTPDLGRRNISNDFARPPANLMRNSTGKSGARNRLSSYGTKQLNVPEKQMVYRNLQAVITNVNRKNLYVLVDKGQSKALRVDKNTELIPVTYPASGDLKPAFKKLLRLMQPTDPDTEEALFNRQLDACGWMDIIYQFMSLSISISSVISVYNSSVALCLEDGSDATCILMAFVQLLQDPYYRSFEGFRILVEKEWLAFGHRFSHRANHSMSSQNSGIAPVFLVFLDLVHQVVHQYPAAFEFNDFYLRFLAYHSQSAFFRTFIFDSDFERQNMEKLAPDNTQGHRGCIWTYIALRSAQSPIFHNLLYKEEGANLFPASSLASLDVWSFYYQDGFVHGTPYDIEIAESEMAQQEEESYSNPEGVTKQEATAEILDARIVADNLRFADGLAQLSQSQACSVPSPARRRKDKNDWKKLWVDAKQKDQESTSNEQPGYEQQVQKYNQKRQALKLMLRGEIQRAVKKQVPQKPQAHSFEYYASSGNQPHDCAVCHFSLYGNVVRTGQRCKHCSIVAHDKCLVNISWPCGQPVMLNKSRVALEPRVIRESSAEKGVNSESEKHTSTLETTFDTSKTLTNGRARCQPLHQGYLQKKGAKFKMWTPRWFVLEPNTHKLNYFENETDSTCRGQIDLFDLAGVYVVHTGSKTLLELHLTHKTISLQCDSKADAELWKEKIEQALRE